MCKWSQVDGVYDSDNHLTEVCRSLSMGSRSVHFHVFKLDIFTKFRRNKLIVML